MDLGFCIIDSLDQPVTHGVGSRLETVERSEIESSLRHGVLDVVHDLSFDTADICADVVLHEVPENLVTSFLGLWHLFTGSLFFDLTKDRRGQLQTSLEPKVRLI